MEEDPKSDLEIGLPQSVQVAVCVDSDRLFIRSQSKGHGGSRAGFQVFALTTGGGLQIDLGAIVLRNHGMLNGADLNGDEIAFDAGNGDMLLHTGLNGSGNQLSHFLAAAYNRDTGVLDFTDNVMTAFIRMLHKSLDCTFLTLLHRIFGRHYNDRYRTISAK